MRAIGKIEEAPVIDDRYEVRGSNIAGIRGMHLLRQHPRRRGATLIERGYWMLTYKERCIRMKSKVGAEVMCMTLRDAVDKPVRP